jgi:hypothetical protein
MKVKDLFTILDSEKYTQEEIKDSDYLEDRIITHLDWEGIRITSSRLSELVALYQSTRLRK